MPVPTTVDSLLNRPGGRLESLVRQSRQFARLTTTIRKLLPETMRPHCLGACLRGDTLVLLTDTSAWATTLRYQSRELLIQLHDHHPQLRKLRVRIIPKQDLASSKTVDQPPQISAATAQLIACLAETMLDPDIGMRLKRLAKRKES